MKHILIISAVLLVAACGNEDNNVAAPGDAGTKVDARSAADGGASGEDVGADDPDGGAADSDGGSGPGDDMGGATTDAGGADDGPEPGCDEVCAGDTPFCSAVVERCVECLSDNDCNTAPEQTCETFGDGAGGDPTFECVECVSDAQCAGATCDLDTNTCVL